MTIEEMRALVNLPPEATDAAVVAAYAALIDDGLPASIVLVEPVTADLARQQCRIDDDVEDDLISINIRAAREWVEGYTSRIVTQRTLVEHFADWGRWSFMEIYRRPVISIDAIIYNGISGDETYTPATFVPGPYPARVHQSPLGWPRLRPGGSVTVAYTAGYDPSEVPACFIASILVIVAGMMAAREGGYAASLETAKALLRDLRPPKRV